MTQTSDRQLVVRLIQDALTERPHLTGMDQLTEDTSLIEFGMDSLDLIVVLSRFEEHWGVPYDDEEVDPLVFETVGQLADTLLARARAAGREP
ncbi:MAG: acyl carrier protein [Pseudonocardiaceae bacterium]